MSSYGEMHLSAITNTKLAIGDVGLGTDSAFAKHRQNVNELDEKLAYADAVEEWSEVTTVEPSRQETCRPRPRPTEVSNPQGGTEASPHISTEEAIEYFKGLDLSEHISGENQRVERRRLCLLFSCFLGSPQLNGYLSPERDLVFAIAKCDLEWSNAVHCRMLQTVYKQFTGDVFDCPRIGNHWQIIGFQGTDPGTDFRGVGMLGLLHLLYLTTSPQLNRFTKDLYKTSIDERQNFPLAVLSLNITCIALQALRHGELNRECNQQDLVIGVVNEYYAAVLFHFLKVYSSENKTIKDTGYLLKDVEWYCRSNVRTTLRNLRNHTNLQMDLNNPFVTDITPFVKGSFQDISLPTRSENCL